MNLNKSTLVSRDKCYQHPNVNSLQVIIVKGKTDVSPKVLDEDKTVDEEDPYRALKIVNRIIWLVVLSVITLVILIAISNSAFSSSGSSLPDNADFS